MKCLLLGLTVALAACAPSLTGPAAADPGAAKLSLTQGDGFKIVRFEAGTLATTATTLTLSGVNLAVNDPSCRAVKAQLVCDVGPLPAGRAYVLPVRGALVVEADYARPGGAVFELAADGP
ncbi:hypothetical protein K7W42_07700 [Deinococcus sp. HMF7604]|uniref:hypothetical protein n=1 Tax=Deinococcus betulae TaxID=2873312 RepID=UPI001CCF29BF|nr:hypothetical protein [Deinococcus betulae]MBZ9750743.1 hypothetical protein [Deinococcus betulae]